MANYHVTPHNGKWQIIGDKGKKAIKVFDTQTEAIEYGRQLAKNQDAGLVIHRPNGRIREKIG